MFTIDFSFKNDKRNKIRIENYDLKNKGRIIINNTNKQMYTNCIDLFNKIKDKIPDIKIVNYGIEHNEIDISLSKNNKELFLIFSNKYLSIYDEDENESYYLFDKYTFEELEDEITDFAYKYFIEI